MIRFGLKKIKLMLTYSSPSSPTDARKFSSLFSISENFIKLKLLYTISIHSSSRYSTSILYVKYYTSTSRFLVEIITFKVKLEDIKILINKR